MKYKGFAFMFVLFIFQWTIGQELNCTVTVNSDRMTDVNPQIFKNLERQVAEFLNNTKWTDIEYQQHEKIACNFFINVSEFKNNNMAATIQVQSSRAIFNSTYSSPIININDKDFNFRYLEFEQLVFDQNSFNSNLTSVLAFYANIIIGLEMDSLSELGGSKYLDSAANIMNVAQSSGFKGWTQAEGNNTNRFFLITDILSNTFTPYRKALYEYHFKGLDIMSEDIQKAKENLISAITTLSDIHKVRPNSFLMRTFFDAKTDEIVSVFSGGPRVDVVSLNETLNRISPLNSVNWNKIR
jgi:hypothetical protein